MGRPVAPLDGDFGAAWAAAVVLVVGVNDRTAPVTGAIRQGVL
ncbi:hypothetical protein [Streptomyces sp. NPDC101178]